MGSFTDPRVWEAFFKMNRGMDGAANLLGREVLTKTFVDWATRIQKGEVPAAPRVQPASSAISWSHSGIGALPTRSSTI